MGVGIIARLDHPLEVQRQELSHDNVVIEGSDRDVM